MLVRLPLTLRESIVRQVGRQRMAAFVREAIEEKLQREAPAEEPAATPGSTD